jgi:hypothetical protein
MPYIGRDTDKISNVEVLDNITFDGSSSYTLQKGGSNFTPSSANTLLLSIDGVVQAGNFTVSGSTIDFGTAVAGTSTCDFVLHYGVGLITAPSDGTVTTAKLADSSVSLAKLTATGTKDATTFLRGDNTFDTPPLGGITVADQFKLTSAFSGDASPIASNLSRISRTGQGTLGTGMTESSGIFTFPSTGIYHVGFTATTQLSGDNRFTFISIQATTDNSTYATVAETISHITQNQSSVTYSVGSCDSLIDVTNTSNVKVRFHISQQNSSTTTRGEATNTTYMTFIRLGDT